MSSNVTATVEDTERVEKRRAQIVTAATQLFIALGFHGATIKDIAQKAGVSSGLVYLYVREKQDVLLLVLLQVVQAFSAELPAAIDGVTDPLARLIGVVDAYCRIVDRHRAATILAYREAANVSPERRVLIEEREAAANDLISHEVVACMKAGLVRKLNVDVVTYQIVLIAHGWALKSWHFKGRVPLDAYVADNLDILLTGILTDAGVQRRQELMAACG